MTYSPLTGQDFLVFSQESQSSDSDMSAPFALGEALLRAVGSPNDQPILHFWSLDQAILLGMTDTKLPDLSEGLKVFARASYRPFVRNAGGLAVVCGRGVTNFSLLFPNQTDSPISIDQAYSWMKDLIVAAFPEAEGRIEAYEIVDSYCPGDFDLSIGGKKFAGIAQRRFKGGISVLIYLSIFGDQDYRGRLIRSFYEAGQAQAASKWHFPLVNPDSMANLSDLLGIELTVQDVQDRIMASLVDMGSSLSEGLLTPQIQTDYEKALEKIQSRNLRLNVDERGARK